MDATHNAITEKIIGAAISVHRALGPGLLEPAYHTASAIEFEHLGLRFRQQVHVPAQYRGHVIGQYRLDFIVEDLIVVEIKAVERMHPLFENRILTYLRATKLRVGLLINFNCPRLIDGVQRFVM